MKPDSMSRVLSHARKNQVCGRATHVCIEFSVSTSRRFQGNRHCLQAKHLDSKNISQTILMAVTMKKIATTQTVAIPGKKSLLAECRTTSRMSLGRRAPNLRHAQQLVRLVSFELAFEDRMSVAGLVRFLKKTFTNILHLLIIFFLIHGNDRS